MSVATRFLAVAFQCRGARKMQTEPTVPVLIGVRELIAHTIPAEGRDRISGSCNRVRLTEKKEEGKVLSNDGKHPTVRLSQAVMKAPLKISLRVPVSYGEEK